MMEPAYGAPFPYFRTSTPILTAGCQRTPLVKVQAAWYRAFASARLSVRGGRAQRFGAGGRAGIMAWEGRELVSACPNGGPLGGDLRSATVFARFRVLREWLPIYLFLGYGAHGGVATNRGPRKIREPVNIIRPFICVLFVRPSISQPSQHVAFDVSLTYRPPTFVIQHSRSVEQHRSKVRLLFVSKLI